MSPMLLLNGLAAAIPNVTISAIVAIAVFAAGTWAMSWLSRHAARDFDKELEAVKASFASEIETLKSANKVREDQIASLRELHVSRLSIQNTALDTRRIQAVEAIWSAVASMGPYRTLANSSAVLKWDAVLNRSEGSSDDAQKLQQFGEILWKTAGMPDQLKPDGADAHRPFVSPETWKLFSAYRLTLGIPAALVGVLRSGMGKDVLQPSKEMLAPIKQVMPDWADFADKWEIAALPTLVRELEERLLAQVVKDLRPETDMVALEKASRVISEIEKMSVTMQEGAGLTIPPEVPTRASPSGA